MIAERDLLRRFLSNNPVACSEQERIMFWRLQKVGSSTILSILLSYGYRNNILPKRKSPGFNRVCENIKKCSALNSSSVVSMREPKAELFEILVVDFICENFVITIN